MRPLDIAAGAVLMVCTAACATAQPASTPPGDATREAPASNVGGVSAEPEGDGASAPLIQTTPSDDEVALAILAIPRLAAGPIALGTRTALGGPALGPPAATERWGLLRVDVAPPAPPLKSGQQDPAAGGRWWAVIWLVPETAGGTLPRFVCPTCAAIALAVLYDQATNAPVAASAPMTVTGHEDLTPEAPLRSGDETFWVLRRHWRHRGNQEQTLQLHTVRKKKLALVGLVPVLYSNEGQCGRVAQVAERKSPIGRDAECKLVYRFEAKLTPTKRGFKSRESSIWAESKKYQQKTLSKTMDYTMRRGTLVATGKSLRKQLPDP